MYLRGRDYCLRSLEPKYPGIGAALVADAPTALARVTTADVALLYWTGAAWGKAVSISLDRPELIADLPAVSAVVRRALSLDEAFNRGALHEVMIALESVPEAMGGSADRALLHFDRAVALSQGATAGPFVSFARSVLVPQQQRTEFVRMLNHALAVDTTRGAFFGGYTTILETAALTALYALVVQVGVHRNIRVWAPLRRVFADSVATIGGVLVILVVAYGLTSYLVDADVPGQLITATRAHVDSRFVFLLALNGFLLGVGCAMDIFTAILVVAPLLVPLGAEFGVHPVHQGVIFVSNLELGYITPPVGLNLFLASYRFNRPLLEVYWASLPMLVILGITVLLITYVPWLTTSMVR